MSEDTWRQIIEIHQYAKELALIGQEINEGFDDFIQPVQEQKHALEHIIRARAAEMGLSRETSGAYIEGNLEKALGHAYREFFDVADWVSIHVRGKILGMVGKYSVECVAAVFPEWYRDIRPKLENLNLQIAEIRKNKDVSTQGGLIEEVATYRARTNELIGWLARIPNYIPQLEECQKEKRQDRVRYYLWTVFLVVLGIGLGYFIGKYLGSS